MKGGDNLDQSFHRTPKRIVLLNLMGLKDDESILNHFPFRYESFFPTVLTQDDNEQKVTIIGEVMDKSMVVRLKNKMTKFTFDVQFCEEIITCIVFNRDFYYRSIAIGSTITVIGKYAHYKKEIMVSSVFPNRNLENKMVPIYHLVDGITNFGFIKFVEAVFSFYNKHHLFVETIPSQYLEKYRLLGCEQAYKQVHFPNNFQEIQQATRYFKYREILEFSILLHFKKNRFKKLKMNVELKKFDFLALKEKLPYQLTDDQEKSLQQIFHDLSSNETMYRLLQGDVGSGKTIVAFLTLIANFHRFKQGALLAPTDILATQHYQNFVKLFENEYEVVLLKGSMKTKEKLEIIEKIRLNNSLIVIGTHALFQEQVIFSNLGLVIIDEQHRFGVDQRTALIDKGECIDVLMMSATPIPRTLAFTLYGDMDVSTIEVFPSKIKKITSHLLLENSIKSILKELKKYLNLGKKIYIVCPLIAESERRNTSTVYEALQTYFKHSVAIGHLHGKLGDGEKEKVMNDFKEGSYSILVATTVIEVGIDVKEADMMIIYEAERFGLAQLHQLRGRIGRSGNEAECYFLTNQKDEETLKRLQFITNCNDGFTIAEYDLKSRGQGNIVGAQQSGFQYFNFASVIDDVKIFEIAKKDALEIIRSVNKDCQKLIEQVKNKYLFNSY